MKSGVLRFKPGVAGWKRKHFLCAVPPPQTAIKIDPVRYLGSFYIALSGTQTRLFKEYAHGPGYCPA